jgi:hypothetical protein
MPSKFDPVAGSLFMASTHLLMERFAPEPREGKCRSPALRRGRSIAERPDNFRAANSVEMLTFYLGPPNARFVANFGHPRTAGGNYVIVYELLTAVQVRSFGPAM